MSASPSLAALKSAWYALEAGAFQSENAPWVPGTDERVIVVIGCVGSVGASTVALALATASAQQSRVIECCPAADSGFSAAASAELGDVDGWRRGSRGAVLIERRLDEAAVPTASASELTILDLPASALASRGRFGWVPGILATEPPLVLVTRPTIPALRRLETCLRQVRDPRRCVVASVGPPARRWPRPVLHSMGPVTGELVLAGRIVAVPEDRTLAYTGLTPDPLSSPLLRAGQEALHVLGKELS